ncbi:MAG: hypothetical protein HFE46_03880 [Clostridia bacterium]|jgi:hypothetical protein|nr:hypothetical protein [Clostridia bacterium]
MNRNQENNKPLATDEQMMQKILLRECGSVQSDEFAADELELHSDSDYAKFARREQYPHDQEFAEDQPPIGESRYFSTCDYTMIPTDDDSVNCQGS